MMRTAFVMSSVLLAGGTSLAAAPSSAQTVELMPHRAVYDLSLGGGDGGNFDSVEGRIVVEMTRKSCDAFELEYRFVARYVGNQELIVVDQQIELEEPLDGSSLDFSNTSSVDGLKEQSSIGTATTRDGTTTVDYDQPGDKTVEITAAAFPIHHTRSLIEAAQAGEFIYETQIFDGDAEAEKETRSTSIISDVDDARPETPGGSTGLNLETETTDQAGDNVESEASEGEGQGKPGAEVLSSLDRWRISEAYYDRTGSPDGEPDFSTSYTLYENGVSDDLTLNFDGYSLEGSMSEFVKLDSPDC